MCDIAKFVEYLFKVQSSTLDNNCVVDYHKELNFYALKIITNLYEAFLHIPNIDQFVNKNWQIPLYPNIYLLHVLIISMQMCLDNIKDFKFDSSLLNDCSSNNIYHQLDKSISHLKDTSKKINNTISSKNSL